MSDQAAVLPDMQALLLQAFAHHQAGRLREAYAGYQAVLEQAPQQPDALHLQGLVCKAQGLLEEGEKLIRRALAERPDFAAAWYNLGNLLLERKQDEAARESYEKAASLGPYPEALYSLGNCWREKDELTRAEQAFSEALALRPHYYEARHNLANVKREQGCVDESIALLKQVLLEKPDLAEAHYNLALSLFTLGRYQEGGPHYEFRFQSKGFTSPKRNFSQPQWLGEGLTCKRLLVHTEQGLGDTLQFIRYIPLVLSRADDVVIEVPAPLLPLLRLSLPPQIQLVAQGSALPAFDFHVPLLSLPWLMGSDGHDVPTPEGYLQIEPENFAKWQSLTSSLPGLKVGLNWQGNPLGKVDKGRSIQLAKLQPLLDVEGVSFLSLQKFEAAKQAQDFAQILSPSPDYAERTDTFLDTVSLLKQLDLFITTDTAYAHLAGALGVKTWVLLKASPDWRWGLKEPKTPWYQSLTLWRQQNPGEWDRPVAAMARSLQSLRAGAPL